MAVSEERGYSLRIRGVRKRFGATTAVDDVSLEAEAGSFLTLLGASGSGKSTTLMLIAGFLEPDAGEIRVDGDEVVGKPAHKRGFGVVFQNYALFPHLTVEENVAFPLRMQNAPKAETAARVAATLDLVKLGALGQRKPHQLSGGQQQRVALARAVVSRPRLLLMDEPLSALDKQLREHMQFELKNIQRKLGVTVVYVTHDQTEALLMSDRIAVMRDGHVEQVGTPREIYDRPATRYTAEFIGDSNFFEGVVTAADAEGCTVDCGGVTMRAAALGGHAVGERVQLIIRPEALRVAGEADLPNRVAGVLEDTYYAGDSIRGRLRTSTGTLMSFKSPRHGAAETLPVGSRVEAAWSARDTVLVRAST